MRYLAWAILAVLSYSLVAPLVSLASEEIPSEVTVVVPNLMLAIATIAFLFVSDVRISEYVSHPDLKYLVVAGLFLSVGIISYYRALGTGPVSIVVPIFGLFLVTSSIVGVVALDEALTARKVAGIGFAMLAVYLTSVE